MKSAVTWYATHRMTCPISTQFWLVLISLRLFQFNRGRRIILTLCVPFQVSEGWTTPELRPKETLAAWENSWPHACCCRYEWKVDGFSQGNHRHPNYDLFVRSSRSPANSDNSDWAGYLLMFVRGLVPTTRLDLLSTDEADDFLSSHQLRRFSRF